MDATIVNKTKTIGYSPTQAPIPPIPPIHPMKKADDYHFVFWLLGLVLSCIPIVIEPIVCLICNDPIFPAICNLFKNTSIIYVGISLIVSALNDLNKNQLSRAIVYVIFLIVAVFVYTVIQVLTIKVGSESMSSLPVILLNLIFFGVALYLGLKQYLSNSGGDKL